MYCKNFVRDFVEKVCDELESRNKICKLNSALLDYDTLEVIFGLTADYSAESGQYVFPNTEHYMKINRKIALSCLHVNKLNWFTLCFISFNMKKRFLLEFIQDLQPHLKCLPKYENFYIKDKIEINLEDWDNEFEGDFIFTDNPKEGFIPFTDWLNKLIAYT